MRSRLSLLLAGFALAACASFSFGGASEPRYSVTARETLTPADAATSLITGGPLRFQTETAPVGEGQDPLVRNTLTAPDGRTLVFQQANHTPHELMTQSAGGPLAQVMGLFGGDETPVLFTRVDGGQGAPFLCGPEGPHAIGYHINPDSSISIVGLKQGFDFETRPDGVTEAVPYSPNLVCARLKFTRS